MAAPAAHRSELIAALDLLNDHFGRGTVQMASAVPVARLPASQPPPWQGLAQWRSGAFTTRLEDLLTVS